MSTVRQLLKEKGSDVWSIAPRITAYEALEIMAEKNVGALPVIDEGEIVGIFSERDYARKVILKDRSSKNTLVRDVMSTTIFYVSPDKTIEECMALMTNKRVRHLPVLENEKLVGIISIGDIVNDIISEQEFAIHELKNYISGTGYGAE